MHSITSIKGPTQGHHFLVFGWMMCQDKVTEMQCLLGSYQNDMPKRMFAV